MNILTKYNIGDSVCILLKESDYANDEELNDEIGGRIGIPVPCGARITDINIHLHESGIVEISYDMDSIVGSDYFTRSQDEVFANWEDMLEHVSSKMKDACASHNSTLRFRTENDQNKD